MPKVSLPEKLRRITTFMYGLNNLNVKRYLAEYGFNEQERKRGWDLFAAAFNTTLLQDGPISNAEANHTLTELDRWENTWFPIVEATLAANYPEISMKVFKNLRQTSGPEVMITVQTLLDRIEALDSTGPAGEARQLLAKRGLHQAELTRARTILNSLKTGQDFDPRSIPEPPHELVDHVWRWYREWATIARVAIPSKRFRIMLGISSRSESEEDEAEGTDEVVSGAPSGTPSGTPSADPFAQM